jgi:predicted metal-dependent phosphotriesterase family hydrolase
VHRKAAETCVFLCFDGISRVKYHPGSVLIDTILKLAERGRERQILIGGDSARRTLYRQLRPGRASDWTTQSPRRRPAQWISPAEGTSFPDF